MLTALLIGLTILLAYFLAKWCYLRFVNNAPARVITWACSRCGYDVVSLRCQCRVGPSPWYPKL